MNIETLINHNIIDLIVDFCDIKSLYKLTIQNKNLSKFLRKELYYRFIWFLEHIDKSEFVYNYYHASYIFPLQIPDSYLLKNKFNFIIESEMNLLINYI